MDVVNFLLLAQHMSVWEGLHFLPRDALSRGAKLCTYLRRFARPDKVQIELYYEQPLPMRRRKFTTSIQPAKAYEDESVIMSGPH